MAASSVLAGLAGPVVGVLVVIVAYCVGVFLSIKCCRPTDGGMLEPSFTTGLHHPHPPDIYRAASPGLDIYIVSRSEDYRINIPRPTLRSGQYLRNDLEQESDVPGLAPAYEEPPTYAECVRNGLA